MYLSLIARKWKLGLLVWSERCINLSPGGQWNIEDQIKRLPNSIKYAVVWCSGWKRVFDYQFEHEPLDDSWVFINASSLIKADISCAWIASTYLGKEELDHSELVWLESLFSHLSGPVMGMWVGTCRSSLLHYVSDCFLTCFTNHANSFTVCAKVHFL